MPENKEVSTTVQSTNELVKRRKNIAFFERAGGGGVAVESDMRR
jgi:hypothetical protein